MITFLQYFAVGIIGGALGAVLVLAGKWLGERRTR